jgi:hypothetical protein
LVEWAVNSIIGYNAIHIKDFADHSVGHLPFSRGLHHHHLPRWADGDAPRCRYHESDQRLR